MTLIVIMAIFNTGVITNDTIKEMLCFTQFITRTAL